MIWDKKNHSYEFKMAQGFWLKGWNFYAYAFLEFLLQNCITEFKTIHFHIAFKTLILFKPNFCSVALPYHKALIG